MLLASIDLNDAHFSANVCEIDYIFLPFVFDGRLFSFDSLVQGLCTAPRDFTKLLKKQVLIFCVEGDIKM